MASYMMFSLLLVFISIGTGSGSEITETHMVFYVHDTFTGKNATAMIAAGVNGSSTNVAKFGATVVVDDLVTEQRQKDSKMLGKAKGAYINADASGVNAAASLLWTIAFEAADDSYDSLQLQGVDSFFRSPREVSVVGGTGKYRFARGYAVVSTEYFDGMDSVLKFEVTTRA
ncbi:hypothetical protein SUGI_1018080 [Cryptomeria japonica]|uniref:dirigent protein 2 n=1 Tax=Cryptomeria japonica TaxID=3369 RepID=UPI0024149095|nr:dirigent protein 2 [Cryptomeria japonica]GLJ48212.1 hypothetical protein SUGI_1018080 [Cryptomeria japonica]